MELFDTLENLSEPMRRDEYAEYLVRSIVLSRIHSEREKREYDRDFHMKSLFMFIGFIVIIKFII